MLPVGVARMRPSACCVRFQPGCKEGVQGGGEGEGGDVGTYDGFREVLAVYVGVNDAQVRVPPAMQRHLVHYLPAFSSSRQRNVSKDVGDRSLPVEAPAHRETVCPSASNT